SGPHLRLMRVRPGPVVGLELSVLPAPRLTQPIPPGGTEAKPDGVGLGRADHFARPTGNRSSPATRSRERASVPAGAEGALVHVVVNDVDHPRPNDDHVVADRLEVDEELLDRFLLLVTVDFEGDGLEGLAREEGQGLVGGIVILTSPGRPVRRRVADL